jgi:hypothetical protein
MLRTTWNALCSLRLTFRLLMACTALFLTGAVYATGNYEFFDSMNSARIQDWIIEKGAMKPGITWWLYPLLACLVLLAINTSCCSLDRIAQIWGLRKSLARRTLYLRLAPSIIHCFFLIVLFGHLLTSSMGEWERYPLVEGGSLELASGEMLTVSYIDHTYFDENSLMNGRIAQTSVLLRNSCGAEIYLKYLEPASYGPYRLMLDMVKDRKRDIPSAQYEPRMSQERESCNKEHIYNTDRQGEQKLFLLAIKDQGLGLVITGFIFILAIMVWYFIEMARTPKEE